MQNRSFNLLLKSVSDWIELFPVILLCFFSNIIYAAPQVKNEWILFRYVYKNGQILIFITWISQGLKITVGDHLWWSVR